MVQFLGMVGVMTLLGLILGGVISWLRPGALARVRPCPRCRGKLVQRGYVGWNGDARTGLRLVTTGEAAPAESFVARLNAAAAAAPAPTAPENEVRLVGALTLYACGGCRATFVEGDGAGLRECTPEQWRELGMPAGSPAGAAP